MSVVGLAEVLEFHLLTTCSEQMTSTPPHPEYMYSSASVFFFSVVSMSVTLACE